MPQLGVSITLVNYAPRVTNYDSRVTNYSPREHLCQNGWYYKNIKIINELSRVV